MPTSRIRPFESASFTVVMRRDGQSEVKKAVWGPEPRIDGVMAMAPLLTRNPPHAGEMHPGGDELIFLISGRLDLIAEEDGGETVTPMGAGQAVVIPKGVWHRLDIKEPCQLVVMTPGPESRHRPLPDPQRPG
jgi:mannose-6-phosphate isomerase-like protein (cupin superfamily)